MKNRARLFTLLAAMTVATTAPAQDAFLVRWQSLRKGQPASVKFTISAAKTRWFLGETTHALRLPPWHREPGSTTIRTRCWFPRGSGTALPES
jgi:hypothetical protein